MPFSDTYALDVASRAEEQLRRDLASAGLDAVDVSVRVSGGDFVFDMAKTDERRVWRYPVDESVYHYGPDGRAADQHALWLSTLAEEENTNFVHRR